jgi:hypothetical protein
MTEGRKPLFFVMDTTWEQIEALAKVAGAKYPQLVAAQWALESGWGKHVSGKNNFFGIKGEGTVVTTTEFVNRKEITIRDAFKDFSSPQECVNYLVKKWYLDYEGYKGVNNAASVESAAKELVKQGYATDPQYAVKLIKLLNSRSKGSAMVKFDSKKFVDFFKNFDDANPKHVAAAQELYAQIDKVKPDLLTDEANWVRIFRSNATPSGVLNVPYFSQRDNYRDAARTCFSSSCAMLCKFLKPTSITGDNDYIREVFKRGDSTDAAVQVQTLKHFGVSSRFATNLSFSTLDSLLAQGIPVPIGILHHGPSTRPSGGGHWIIVIGKEVDPAAPGGAWYIVNDPWGEISNASGTYPSANGNRVKYSHNLLKARWTVEGPSTGWAIIAQKPG